MVKPRTSRTPDSPERKGGSGFYGPDSPCKPVGIVLSKAVLARLDERAALIGVRRNDLIRQAILNIAYPEHMYIVARGGIDALTEDEKTTLAQMTAGA